jgi:hypothetical protein
MEYLIMSTLHEITEINFEGRKPSKPQIMRAIGKALEKGTMAIEISWGENRIDLTFDDRQYGTGWYGTGWIKGIGGSDIAAELNDIRKEAQKFIKDHFTFVHIK